MGGSCRRIRRTRGFHDTGGDRAHPPQIPDAGFSLPAWVYRDPEFHRIEMARVMRPSWQVVCHVNDIPAAGDYRLLNFLGESIVVIRGDDGMVRALSNVCRHRGARILDQAAGCTASLPAPTTPGPMNWTAA